MLEILEFGRVKLGVKDEFSEPWKRKNLNPRKNHDFDTKIAFQKKLINPNENHRNEVRMIFIWEKQLFQ